MSKTRLVLTYVLPTTWVLTSLALHAGLSPWLAVPLGLLASQLVLVGIVQGLYVSRPYGRAPLAWGLHALLAFEISCAGLRVLGVGVPWFLPGLLAAALGLGFMLFVMVSVLRRIRSTPPAEPLEVSRSGDSPGDVGGFAPRIRFDRTGLIGSPLVAGALPIERKRDIDKREFSQLHLSGRGRPVIVQDGMKDWSVANFTFEKLVSRCGGDIIDATSPLFKEQKFGKKATRPCQIRCTFEEYVKHVQNPLYEPKGTWIQGRFEDVLFNQQPLYNPGYNPFRRHPEMLRECNRFRQYYVTDYLQSIPWPFRRLLHYTPPPTYYLMIAAAGSGCQLHQDFNNTHVLLCQIAGRKHVFLADSSQSAWMDRDRDPFDPPPDTKLGGAKLQYGVLEPGEILFLPAGTYHSVFASETSLTLVYNFVNQSQPWSSYMYYIKSLLPMVPFMPALEMFDFESAPAIYFLE